MCAVVLMLSSARLGVGTFGLICNRLHVKEAGGTVQYDGTTEDEETQRPTTSDGYFIEYHECVGCSGVCCPMSL